jgi:hypothetical protein
MSKITTFEDLQELGCSSIHENTHIARSKVDQILTKSFGDMNRVQFMGFISILEREYHLNLDEIRNEYDEYINFHPDIAMSKKSVILQAQSHSKKWWAIGILVFIVVLIVMTSKTQNSLGLSPNEDVIQLSSAAVEVVETNVTTEEASLEMNASDTNTTDANITTPSTLMVTDTNQSDLTKNSGVDLGKITTIIPVAKVWMGMMDSKTGVKTQKVTDQPIRLDSTKDTLFIFGHGRLMMLGLDKNITLQERNTAWFYSEKGKLYQLTHEQFRTKNKGTSW